MFLEIRQVYGRNGLFLQMRLHSFYPCNAVTCSHSLAEGFPSFAEDFPSFAEGRQQDGSSPISADPSCLPIFLASS